MEPFGVLYIALEGWRQQEAVRSHRSLRHFNPGIRTAIVIPHGAYGSIFREFNYVISARKRNNIPENAEKVCGLLLSPFEVSLFLDNATHIRGDVSHMSKLLGGSIIAACAAGTSHPDQIDTGVILYDRHGAANLIDEWTARLLRTPSDHGNESFLSDPTRVSENLPKLKILPFAKYNCQDQDIWAAVVNGKINEAIILQTHDWEVFYNVFPAEQRLLFQLIKGQDFIKSTFDHVNALKSQGKRLEAITYLQVAIGHFLICTFLSRQDIWVAGGQSRKRQRLLATCDGTGTTIGVLLCAMGGVSFHRWPAGGGRRSRAQGSHP
jgi:hypothetical protein